MAEGRYGAPNVVGSAELLAKKSAVDELGHLRSRPVDGVVFRPTRPVPHEDGFLTEVARASWDALDKASDAGAHHYNVSRADPCLGLHQASVDRLFVVSGLVKIVVYDGRLDSPTHGHYTELVASERNPGLLTIPPDLYHAGRTSASPRRSSSTCPRRCTTTKTRRARHALGLPGGPGAHPLHVVIGAHRWRSRPAQALDLGRRRDEPGNLDPAGDCCMGYVLTVPFNFIR